MSRPLRLLTVLTALLPFGIALTPMSPAAGGPVEEYIIIETPVAPPVVFPGEVVPVSIPVNNSAEFPVTMWMRWQVFCPGVRPFRLITGKGPFRPYEIPPSNTPNMTYNPSPEIWISGLVRIPAKCAATKPGDTGLITAHVRSVPPGERDAFVKIGLPFSRQNARRNLGFKDGVKGKNYDAHHELPQKFRALFKQRGLNIDDPKYMTWWCKKAGVPTNHQANAAGYNQRWETYFEQNPNATKGQILAFLDSIIGLYTYVCP